MRLDGLAPAGSVCRGTDCRSSNGSRRPSTRRTTAASCSRRSSPSRIEVAGDGECDLDDALRGTPAADYRAPEREGGAAASAEADVYAAGAIAWEVLVGRPYAPAPAHLSEARTDLPADLADA